MLLERIARKLKITLLPPPSRLEAELIGQLRHSIRQLPPLSPASSEQSAEGLWTRHRIALREQILSDDPRRFLNWAVIKNTMFFSNTPFITPAFESLRGSEQWQSRWKDALRESKVGLPLGFPAYPESSGNLVHHAYHLSQFERHSRIAVESCQVIVEFGGGYGSTCRLAHRLGFKGRYFIYDLPEFSALQRFYLRLNGLHVLDEQGSAQAQDAVVCLSSLDELASQLQTRTIDLFIANWSLSETPLELRNSFLPLVAGARAFLIGYQDRFGEVDNQQFFADWKTGLPAVSWTDVRIAHLPANNYLIGTLTANSH